MNSSQFRTTLKAVLPAWSHRYVSWRHHAFVFWRAMRKFVSDPMAALDSDSTLLGDLIYGWDNAGWCAVDDYLKACIRHATTCEGPILECGAGLSTILVGAIATKRKIDMWSLDHKYRWGARVEACLAKYQFSAVRVCVAPLKNYGTYSWYEPPLASMPEAFKLVMCDGPPGTIRGGRYGLSPIMRDKLGKGCVIVLDDAARESEQAIAARWSAELGASHEVHGGNRPYIELVVGGDRISRDQC